MAAGVKSHRPVVTPSRSVQRLHAIAVLALLLGPACAYIPTKPFAPLAVSGKVMDSLGRPLPNAVLLFRPAERRLELVSDPQQARADSSGSYSVEVTAGAWRVDVGILTSFSFIGWFREYDISFSPEHRTVDFRLESYRVEGRVIGPTGSAVDSGYVDAEGARGDNGESRLASGRFALTLPPGTYSFYARSFPTENGLPSQTLTAVPVRADTSFDIVLAGDPVTGVVSGPGGAPLESVFVTASGSVISSRVWTGSDGRYALYIPPGDYRFLCYPRAADSYILPRIFPLRAVTGATAMDLSLTGVEWSGVIRSSTTLQPIAGARVTAAMFADAYTRSATTTTDLSGQFRIVLEPNREYSLEFSADGAAALRYSGIGATTADTTFDIVLDPAPTP